MARSTLNNTSICISLDKNLTDDLKKYAEITGKQISRVVAECLEQRLMPLRNSRKGCIEPIDGQYYTHRDAAPQMCRILNETTMYGDPYYTIYFDGNIRSVPRDSVQLLATSTAEPLDNTFSEEGEV